MPEARKLLKAQIEQMDDALLLEKVRIFIMGMSAQQKIDLSEPPSAKTDLTSNKGGTHSLC